MGDALFCDHCGKPIPNPHWGILLKRIVGRTANGDLSSTAPVLRRAHEDCWPAYEEKIQPLLGTFDGVTYTLET